MSTEDQQYTLEEVSKNNGKNGADAWIVVKDKVYDVTSFLHEHPGGAEIIEDVLGKDATKDFDDAGHSYDAIQMLKRRKIGQIVENERKYDKKKKNPPKVENGEQKQKSTLRKILTCGLC